MFLLLSGLYQQHNILHLISPLINFIGSPMVATGLIRRNRVWLLDLKISLCSRDMTICHPALLSALHFSFPALVRPEEEALNHHQGGVHNPRRGRDHRSCDL